MGVASAGSGSTQITYLGGDGAGDVCHRLARQGGLPRGALDVSDAHRVCSVLMEGSKKRCFEKSAVKHRRRSRSCGTQRGSLQQEFENSCGACWSFSKLYILSIKEGMEHKERSQRSVDERAPSEHESGHGPYGHVGRRGNTTQQAHESSTELFQRGQV